MNLRKIMFALAALASLDASAGLVLDRTRLIYPEGAPHVNLLITNPDEFSNIAQVWMDKEDPSSTPDSIDADEVPFFITPPVARIDSGKGQTVRVSYTGADLPRDRETVFHLNVLQIPPRNSMSENLNSLTILLRTRIKVFYRPKNLTGASGRVLESIEFKRAAEGVVAVNPTPFYASFSEAYIVGSRGKVKLDYKMIPPFSEVLWQADGDVVGMEVVEASFVNDYGAVISLNKNLSR